MYLIRVFSSLLINSNIILGQCMLLVIHSGTRSKTTVHCNTVRYYYIQNPSTAVCSKPEDGLIVFLRNISQDLQI